MLVTWEIGSRPWLGDRDPIRLLTEEFVAGKKLLKLWSYLWEPVFSSFFARLHMLVKKEGGVTGRYK